MTEAPMAKTVPCMPWIEDVSRDSRMKARITLPSRTSMPTMPD